ncbi:ribosome-associated protein [Raineyella antarctica]|uniref:Ribosome-associated protein n=1 Tax=Raineyella antarctica TaxID=1577474 RepID=A0A1G6H8R8_9ACTN|nr:RNA-binding S4 domain-containing protein [Raineyella antarctica]SDB90345.1 ribosome-associated protein [Raineyella antarctica]
MSTAPEPPDENTPDHEAETIRLGQFLKWANLAETGGEARELVQGGYVRVDGEVETRRGRQLHVGQRVTLAYPGEREVTVVVEDL